MYAKTLAATMRWTRPSVGWAEAATVPQCLLTPDMQNRKTIDAVFAAVSAPTVAAARLADKLNLSRIGFLRLETCVAYSGFNLMKEAKA